MVLLDGKKTANDIKDEITVSVNEMIERGEKVPHLAAVLVGSDGASLTYVGSKVRACERVGFNSTLVELPETTSEEELLKTIQDLNENDDIDGFIVQLPLPKHIDEQKVLNAVNPTKDVDGFHPENFGRMALEMESFIPATPYGILQLLERYHVETKGKHTVVIGRSHIVGRPISILMSQKGPAGNSMVTLTHSYTKNLSEITKQADIIIVALGVPEFLKASMVKDGVVIIDVGISRVPDATKPRGYAIKGDVAFDEVSKKSSFITPVPGGVGPMTIAMLLKNTLIARKRNA
jgi:methylenetetrahydrofolate dehydrogenase (NADP+)/methenyltetrahydrofolate cyclohydrolase